MYKLLACLVILLELASVARADRPAIVAPTQLDPASIDRFIAMQMVRQRVPGLALAVIHGDKVLFAEGYGTADDGQPVTLRTQFFIASLSKSITAVAVLQLAEAGKLDLDASVQTYLPTFELAGTASAWPITIRQLLYQISGLADAGFPESRLPQPDSLAGRVASLRSARPVAAPGTAFHYFNPNYQILARVVEVVSGMPFAAYLQARIFGPLQMRDTFSAATSAQAIQHAKRLARGHLVVFGVPVPARELDGFLAGSGGVISTAADMAQYLVAQNTGGRYGETTLATAATMATLHTPPPQPQSDYAMGWFVHREGGLQVIEHNGVLSTFYAEAVLLPERGDGFVLLANANGAASAFVGYAAIKRGLIAVLTGDQAPASSIDVGLIGNGMGLLTLISVGVALRSLLRLPRRQQARAGRWTLVAKSVWSCAPLIVLLALPALLVRLADRAFGYQEIIRSMPDVVIWLGLTGAIGSVTTVVRLVLRKRRA